VHLVDAGEVHLVDADEVHLVVVDEAWDMGVHNLGILSIY